METGYAAEVRATDRLQPAAPTPELTAALEELSGLGKRIAETRSVLTGFTERLLVGDAPVSSGEQAERARNPYNCGLTGQIRCSIEGITEIADDVLRLANRLRQIG